MISSFEQLLLDKGYTRFIYSKNKQWEPDNLPDSLFYYSSMGNTLVKYKNNTNEFYYGLHEENHPPTLVYPRPNIKVIRLDKNGEKECISQVFDSAFDVCMQHELVENIYNGCLDKSINFYYDLTKDVSKSI